jgi:prophage regulatory protein
MSATLKPIYLDLQAVSDALSLSEASVKRLVREDKFPKPRMLSGRRVAWLTNEVEAWAQGRPVSDILPPPNTGNRKGAIRAVQAPTVQDAERGA